MFRKKKAAEADETEFLVEDMAEGLSDLPEDGAVKKKKKMPGWVIVPILAGLVLIFWILSVVAGGSAKVGSEFQTVKVEKGSIKEVYNTSGTVESEKTKVFYSPVNAPVVTCNAKVGETVKAGDILVAFDTANLERDNRQSELNAQSAKYTNQDAIEQNSRAAKTTAQAKAQAAAAVQNVQNQIQQKQEQVNQLGQAAAAAGSAAAGNAAKAEDINNKMKANLNAQSDQRTKKENADRKLSGLTAGTPEYNDVLREAQEATEALGSLEIQYRDLEQQLNQIGSSDDSGTAAALAAAQQELSALKASLAELQNSTGGADADTGLTGAQVQNMQISENLADLSLLTTEELLAKGQEGIKAEFDGIISDVKALEGSDAMQGAELFTLVSNQDVNVRLEVSANDFDHLSVGSKATIKIGKKSYKGTLRSIDKIALPNEKGTPVIGAQVHIDDPDEEIYIGVSAKVSMTVAEEKDVLCLSNELVNTSTDGDFVYMIQNGTVKKQMVELGVASGSKVEIKDGLKEGDQVVSDVSGDIKEGMKATGAEGKTSDKE